MIDFSIVGREGLIIQFEDIISMIGFNMVRYFKLKDPSILPDRSLEDLLFAYINRENENYDEWVSDLIKTPIDIKTYIDSVNAFQPSFLYAFKVFKAAKDNGLSNLMVHSNVEIPFIRNHILPTFLDSSVKYVYGDIVPIINSHPNITYLTSSPSNIKRCLDVEVPFALTIVDQFMYTADVLINKLPDKLIERNVFVAYTGIFSSGFIDDIK